MLKMFLPALTIQEMSVSYMLTVKCIQCFKKQILVFNLLFVILTVYIFICVCARTHKYIYSYVCIYAHIHTY